MNKITKYLKLIDQIDQNYSDELITKLDNLYLSLTDEEIEIVELRLLKENNEN